MKKLLAILAVIVLITACSPQSGGENIAIDASESDITKTYQAAGNDTITLNGLKHGSIYTIYPESASNSRSKSSQSFVKSTTDTIIFIPDAETETFRAGDLGIDEGAFRIIEQLPAGGDMIINTSTDKPLFTNSKGQKVYEKYFEIPVSNLSDSANTVIFDYMTGSSSNTSSDYGIIVDGKKTRSAGIMDFSDEESIIVYIQCHYGTLNTPTCTYGAKVDTPKSIGTGNLEAPNAYRIEKADDELVLELEINSSEMKDFSALTRYPWPRSAESGMITGNMVPMKYENGKLLFYIGKISEDILVNILSEKGKATIGSAVVRPIKSDEKSLIQEWDIVESDTFPIDIPESDSFWIYPIHLTNGGKRITGATITYDSTVNTTPGFYVMAPNTNGKGFTSIMVNAEKHSISLDSRFFIDFGYFYMKGANNTGAVTLKIAR